jgi:dihydrofolate reductase
VTRNRSFVAEGAIVVHSIEEALHVAKEDQCPMIIGGATIYEQALPFITVIHVTHVQHEGEGDVFFPFLDAEWIEVSRHAGKNPALSFVRMERRQ